MDRPPGGRANSGKSPLASAMRYTPTRMPRLWPDLNHSILELESNTAERTMRFVAIRCKNDLFVRSQTGSKTAAIIYNTKLSRIEPQALLGGTLARIPDYKSTASMTHCHGKRPHRAADRMLI
ncbi:MAG: transposase [Paracoccaceae bacterium]|uniref:IS66 family transposase n=1 Tax=Shimia thalassica TaxID=1715693 RepID=UPI00329F5B65